MSNRLSRRPHDRTTFATPTLKLINGRISYYRKLVSGALPFASAYSLAYYRLYFVMPQRMELEGGCTV